MSSIAHSRPSVTIQAAFCMGCVVYEALKTLNLNEAKWAMERVILWAVGSLAHFDYTITEIGDTRKYRFFLDGWVFYDVVLSPTMTGGQWGYSLKLIPAYDGQNSERLAAYKKAVMQLPEWQRELYSELPDFTHIAQQLDMRLQQEWGGLVTAKRDSAAKDEDEAIKRPQEHPDRAAIEMDENALGIRARRLGIRPSRLERWDKIIKDYIPKGLTQAKIAEVETVSIETIRKDFNHMRKHELLPTKEATPKTTP